MLVPITLKNKQKVFSEINSESKHKFKNLPAWQQRNFIKEYIGKKKVRKINSNFTEGSGTKVNNLKSNNLVHEAAVRAHSFLEDSPKDSNFLKKNHDL